MRASAMYGGAAASGDMGEGVGAGGSIVKQWLLSLPSWALYLLITLGVMLLAYVAGIVLGKLYASFRYPDPEKNRILDPRVKAGFLVLLVAGGYWLYTTLTAEETLPVDADEPYSDGAEGESPDGMSPDGENPGDSDPDGEDDTSPDDGEALPDNPGSSGGGGYSGGSGNVIISRPGGGVAILR